MKLNEIYKVLDEIAPKALSDEYCARFHAYDNSGVLVDSGEEIEKILFSLDLTQGAIDEAIETGAKLIVTHHPAIYGKISDVLINDPAVVGTKLIRCIKNGISVISMHLNLDVAKDGIDENLAKGIRFCANGQETPAKEERMHCLEDGGYGRAYCVEEISLSALTENLKKIFSTARILSYGKADKKIKRIASFCGAGADEETVAFAAASGADLMVSSDFKHHLLTMAQERGMAVIVLTHYASESYGFKKYYQKICQKISLSCTYHEEDLF
ncbi:MAG: Nif3-like dinuclear metal center hexameric protein [Clostridia bacterium]|nr:Nif3-like dinuclear metal center hexameric protein [Clostridia bacterium]